MWVRGEYKAKTKFLGRPHKIAILDWDAPMIFTPGHRDLDLDASNLFKKKLLFTGSQVPSPPQEQEGGGRRLYDLRF